MSQRRATVQAARTPARRPEARYLDIQVADGAYAGWAATMLTSFPAGWLVRMQSGDFGQVLDVLGRIIQAHNFPGPDGALAATLDDVELPGLLAIVDAFGEAMRTLPPA